MSIQSTESTGGPAVATLSDLAACEKHCVFRCGGSWFSVPAVSVREISIAPSLVRVPGCDASLAGLCHLRSEFIPVISLGSLLDIDHCDPSDTQDRLLVFGGSTVWSLLIAEAAALDSLETIVSPEARTDDARASAVRGTAMFRDQIVRVLDTNSLFRLAQQALEELWGKSQQPIHQPAREEGSQR